MAKAKHSNYSALIGERILLIMQYSGLTIKGLEEITKVSDSHIYALLNGNKRITDSVAEKLSIPFNLKGAQLLNLDYEIPETIRKAPELIKFKKEYKGNIEYFNETKNNSKSSYFIEYGFLHDAIFDDPVYLWEIIEKLEQHYQKYYKNKDLSQILHYLVVKNKLTSEKRPLKLKTGGYGQRIVDVFFRWPKK